MDKSMKNENLKSWEKGQSGNPEGKKKGTKNRSTIARKWLEVMSKAENPLTNEEEELSQEDQMTLSLISRAKDGCEKSYKALMDSGYGSPTQVVEQTNIDKKPAKIEFTKSDNLDVAD